MALIKHINLENSDNNIVVSEVNDGIVVINTFDWEQIVSTHTHELQTRIGELRQHIETLQTAQEQSTDLFDQKRENFERQIADLTVELHIREQRIRELVEQFRDRNISDLSATYQQAFHLFVEGSMVKALQVLSETRLEENERQQADNRILKGEILFFSNKLAEAEQNFKRAVELSPTSSSYYALGTFYCNTQRHKLACKVYRKALQLYTDDLSRAPVLSMIGRCQLELGNIASAERYATKAVDLLVKIDGPINLPPQEALRIFCRSAEVAKEKGDLKKAESIYREALRAITQLEYHIGLEPTAEHANILGGLASLLSDAKRYEEALAYFEQTITIHERLTPTDPQRHIPLLAQELLESGIIQEQMGDMESSKIRFQRAFNLLREFPRINTWYAPIYSRVLISMAMRRIEELGKLCRDEWQEQDEVRMYLEQAREVIEPLVPIYPELYIPKMFFIHFKLGALADKKSVLESHLASASKYFRQMTSKQQAAWANMGAYMIVTLEVLANQTDDQTPVVVPAYALAEAIRLMKIHVKNDPDDDEAARCLALWRWQFAEHYPDSPREDL